MNRFENYWKTFIIQNSQGKQVYDGKKFENLIEELLSIMYGVKWNNTNTTHDGNKDFYLIKDSELLWAECKNYKDSIALNVLAPTLVMAQVCDANVILFFSRSTINKFAKDKITSFGHKTSKKVIFYDAQVLEYLILKHNDKLSSELQVSCESTKQITKRQQEFTVSEYFFPSTYSSMVTEEENYKSYLNASILHYNEPFSLLLICCNNTAHNSRLKIMFAEDNEDKNCYEYLDKNITISNVQIADDSLQSGESRAFLINLRISVFQSNILLPKFTVKFETSDAKTFEWTSESKRVQCKWIGMTKLLGDHYNKIIADVESRLVENTSFSAMLLSGSSGTGKSRILRECHCPLLKYGYRILELNVTNEHATSSLLKEIIYFLYEIPAELIKDVINARIEGVADYENATEIIRISKMIDVIEDNNFKLFMHDYKELLFEKMSRNKIAIIIDNMQFAPDDFQEFGKEYLKFAVNQCRENRSILIVSMNSDYITETASKTIYMLKNSNIRYFVDEVVSGFKNTNQGILFLRELIHIKDETYDSLFKNIVDSVSLNPFNLYQMIKLMEEDEVVKQLSDRQGYIFAQEAIWKSTWKIPADIDETLERRLNFIEKYLEPDRLYNILSVCYLLETFNLSEMEMFQMNFEEIKFLTDHQILIFSETGVCFAHDIIRNFFERKYRDKRLNCLKNLKCSEETLMQYSVLYKMVQICIVKDNHYILDFCRKKYLNSIPVKIRGIFLENLFQHVIANKTIFANNDEWVAALTWICSCTRNIMGSAKALEFYNRTYDCMENRIENFSTICSFELRHLFHSHCDILIQMHHREEAIAFAEKILNALQEEPIQEQMQTNEDYREKLDEYYVLKAIMYNRIFCAYNNHYPNENIIQKRNRAIARSRELISFIQNMHKRNLIAYLNNSDEGYRYYGFFSNYDNLMHIWEKCLIDIPTIAPEKTMNYYRKCVQYYLIQRNEAETKKYIALGREYLKDGKYSHEPLIFNTFFTMAEVMCCLQHKPKTTSAYVERLLNDLTNIQLILKSDKMGDIFLLKGINAFYQQDDNTAYYALKRAYFAYHEKETTNYWIKRSLITENIIITYSLMEIPQKGYDISFLPNKCIEELLSSYRKEFRAQGIIRTNDLQFNLPLVV